MHVNIVTYMNIDIFHHCFRQPKTLAVSPFLNFRNHDLAPSVDIHCISALAKVKNSLQSLKFKLLISLNSELITQAFTAL